MHSPSEADPPPDDAEYIDDVICEHNGLVTNPSSRRRISAKVSGRDIYPSAKQTDGHTGVRHHQESLSLSGIATSFA